MVMVVPQRWSTLARSGRLSAADLDPGVEAQLVEEIGDAGLNSAPGQEQPGCDLLVVEVADDEPRDV